ncbi:hypothetical protein V6N12_024652 [Hibiscus sabdariffa]|uniref:RNase H type-1 domain-containing protein n=1 Tax=Hibiscus sabdariffa TaxID=183260 RepID=A0ABR2G153_9ROSI
MHMLRDYSVPRLLWRQLLPTALEQSFFSMNLQAWLSCNLSSTLLHPVWNLPWNLLFASFVWQIWKNRNDVTFGNMPLFDEAMFSRSLAWASNYHGCVVAGKSLPIAPRMKLAWEFGFEILLIRSDCRQAVDLVNSDSADSSVLSLVRAIARLRQKCWLTDVIWVPRDKNRLADPSVLSLCVYTNLPT